MDGPVVIEAVVDPFEPSRRPAEGHAGTNAASRSEWCRRKHLFAVFSACVLISKKKSMAEGTKIANCH